MDVATTVRAPSGSGREEVPTMSPIDDGNELPALAGGLDENLAATEGDADRIVLSLEDLLPDANGEIVVLSQQGQLHLNLMTDLRVCESGVATSHVMADGLDVHGLSFYAFEGGTRVYYSSDVEITISATHQG
jgi:hypothetical protein